MFSKNLWNIPQINKNKTESSQDVTGWTWKQLTNYSQKSPRTLFGVRINVSDLNPASAVNCGAPELHDDDVNPKNVYIVGS